MNWGPILTTLTKTNNLAIIAVDGPAASGKGTLARTMAAHFNYAYLDTGALYRGVALLVLQNYADPSDDIAALNAARQLDLATLETPGVKAALRRQAVGEAASRVAAKPDVRQQILQMQRDFAAHPPDAKAGAILDGRDIATVVCPWATHKLFITARADVRAHRRFLELKQNDATILQTDVLADIKARDTRDMNRATAPLRQAEDAHLLDTSDLSIEEALMAALALIT